MSERDIVNALNKFIGTSGISFRLKQSRFSEQFIDILVHSRKFGHYGIEHKSMKNSKNKSLYFSSSFSVDKHGVHQVERISDFITRGGLKGYLIVEMKNGRGKDKTWFAIPWTRVERLYNKGRKSISHKLFNKKYQITLEKIGRILK